ncbi:Heat shock 70 kDa protein 12B [Mycena venus]|uniref:Heat shock 70 kDa protein 12B n=1 Tax=Mycena venus TaxID=2733690 RepID=A0A8H6X5D4_9AGAR|nr:Heat shock 70 kDa protein 12B [Mycena venus]
MSSPSPGSDSHRESALPIPFEGSDPGPSQDAIAAFCDAIRKKTDWYHKLLDPIRRLDLKWAEEAGFAGFDPAIGMKANVAAALEELKNEASRILFYDFEIRMGSTPIPNTAQTVDFESEAYAAAPSHALRAPVGLTEAVGVFISDNLVPPVLHRELVVHLDALAQTGPPDLHPGSGGKVQDLIHPSLYPFALGESALNDASKSHARRTIFSTDVVMGDQDETFTSRYAWIPAVFQVADDGRDVRIEPNSYINGLGPRARFPVLYRLIEKVFLATLPHLKQTLGFDYIYSESSSVDRWRDRFAVRETDSGDNYSVKRSVWDKLLEEQAAQRVGEMSREELRLQDAVEVTSNDPSSECAPVDTSIFRGRRFKVIVKAANYLLTAGQSYEGTWHMEGMPHERIVASVIYYYDTDRGIVDDGLEFRKFRDPEVDFPQTKELRHEAFGFRFEREGGHGDDETADKIKGDDEEGDENEDDEDEDYEEDRERDYPSDWGDMVTTGISRFISLGSVPTTNIRSSAGETIGSGTGRILSFPNWIQHKVGRLSVAEDTPVGQVVKRKILCFFIVEDEDDPQPDSNSDADPAHSDSDAIADMNQEINIDDAEEPSLMKDGTSDPGFVAAGDDPDPDETSENENLQNDNDHADSDKNEPEEEINSVHSEHERTYHGVWFSQLPGRVVTAADVPLQIRGTNFRTLRVLLPFVCQQLTGKRLPPELVQYVLDVGYWGFSREEAERHRRLLMQDRVVRDTRRDHWGYSLCEH